MAVYRVLMHGTGFRYKIDGVMATVGFYVTRVVDSANGPDACAAAIDLVRARLDAGRSFTELSRITVESVEQILEDIPSVQPGFAWFHEK